MGRRVGGGIESIRNWYPFASREGAFVLSGRRFVLGGVVLLLGSSQLWRFGRAVYRVGELDLVLRPGVQAELLVGWVVRGRHFTWGR